MGGIIGNIVDTVSDGFGDVVDVVSKAAEEMVNLAESAAKITVNFSMTITGTKYLDEKLTGGLIFNSVNGFLDNVAGTMNGALEGDWTKFRDSVLGTLNTAIAVTAIVVGVSTGNLALIAAGVVMLDAQYNQGELLSRTIAIAGDIESATIGTNYIDTYATELQMAITVAATMYAGYYAIPILMDWTGINAALADWKTQIEMIKYYAGTGYGIYQTYSAIEMIRASQAYWEERLRIAEEQFKKWVDQLNNARETWIGMFTDTDMINRIMAGGDLFFMGAGHDLFSITDVAEPKYALGLIDKSDHQMDVLINNRNNLSMAGSDNFTKYNNGG